MDWMTASECADWWAGLLSRKNSELDAWMEKNNHGADGVVGFTMYVGTHSAVDAANLLFLDNLQLGQGAGGASVGGTKWGYVADATRLAAFFPLAKLPGVASREMAAVAARGTLAKTAAVEAAGGRALSKGAVAFEAGPVASADAVLSREEAQIYKIADAYEAAPICWAVAPIQALNHAGKYWMRLEHIAKLYVQPGMTELEALCKFKTYNVERVSNIFKHYKIPHQVCNAAHIEKCAKGTTEVIEVLENMIPKNRAGALVFGVRWKDAMNAGHAHIMYAARDSKGLVQICNRGGEVVRDLRKLAQLGSGYNGIERATMKGVDMAIFIESTKVSSFVQGNLKSAIPMLLMPIFLRPTLASNTRH